MPVLPNDYYERVWEHWEQTRGMRVVHDKMPIPYFGNVAGLLTLPREKRIVTVAINPNADLQPITQVTHRLNPEDTEFRLSTYFTARRVRNPNWCGWFSWYENVLNGLNASYWDAQRPVLHADYRSPIATDPTWGGLTGAEKAALEEAGVPLFFDLMHILDPRLLLVSISSDGTSDLLERLLAIWPRSGPEELLCRIDTRADGTPRNPPYEVFWQTLSDHAGKELSIVFGASHIGHPFGIVTGDQRRTIGLAIKNRLGWS